MTRKALDFLVTAVDNFGDTGFALDLAESVLHARPDWNVRFFSDDLALFERLTAGRPHPKTSYLELSEYENAEPSTSIISFFDRKLPEAHFKKSPRPKKILQLSYLRFDPGVASMNGTRYFLGNDEVVHLVPSPLERGAGIVVGRAADVGMDGPLSDGEVPKPENSDILVASAFYYPSTRAKLRLIRETEPKIRFAEFGNADAETCLPFVRFDEYASMLGNFGANVVRGENSAMKAIIAGKPFLWDFYKEANGAHQEKIGDFLDFMKPFFADGKSIANYAEAVRAFNSDEFDSESARKCGDVLMANDPSSSQAFRKASQKIRERDLARTVIAELET